MRSMMLLLSALLTCALGWTYPTSTNLAPSSEVMSDGKLRLEVSATSYGGLFRSQTERYIYSQFGWRKLEIGLDIYRYPDEDGNYETRWAFNVKAKVWNKGKNRPALAVGICDIGKGLVSSPYAVLGKTSGRSLWHLGFGRFGGNERWWIAVEYPLNSWISLVCDRLSGSDAHTSLGVYWSLSEEVELSVAFAYPHRKQNEEAIFLTFTWER